MDEKSYISASVLGLKSRFIYLLIAILGMIIGSPFLDELLPFRHIRTILLTIIFISSIYAVSQKKQHIIIAAALALPMLISLWSFHIHKLVFVFIISQFFVALFIAFTIYCLIDFILKQQEITREVIYAAVIVYFLMALLWSFAYSILEYFYPNSFSYAGGPREDMYRFLYFSFITITTLGYGDIIPMTEKASALAVLEAVSGQMYLVVVVAWLVGMHVSRRSR